MSNLRSDCQHLLEAQYPGSLWASHIRALIVQIDHVVAESQQAFRERNDARDRARDYRDLLTMTDEFCDSDITAIPEDWE